MIRKFVLSLTNKEKGDLLRIIADTCYKDKGKVLDYLYDLANFIAQDPDPKPVKEVMPEKYEDNDFRLNGEEKELIRANTSVSAIKSLRQRYITMSFQEAKRIVKAFEASINPYNLPPSTTFNPHGFGVNYIPAGIGAGINIGPEIEEPTLSNEEKQMVRNGNKMGAIKAMRARVVNIKLKDAAQIINRWAADNVPRRSSADRSLF